MNTLTPEETKDTGDTLKMVAHVLDGVLNKDVTQDKLGFVILVFNRKDGADMSNYVSNCSRSDTITAMRETAARLEAKLGAS